MRKRARNESGFLLIEVIAAMMIITIALLALMGAYSFGFFAIGAAGTNTSAGLLANNQLELYSSLSYSSIGFTSAELASGQADSTWIADESALPGSGTDVTIGSCTSSLAQCKPVQTPVTGSDNKPYRVETFIRCVANPSVSGRKEKIVTVIVRNASASSSAKVVTMQTAFDQNLATSC